MTNSTKKQPPGITLQMKRPDVIPASLWKVIVINDDITPLDFVVNLFVDVFHFNEDTATISSYEVHERGSSIVGIYIKDIAETKVALATKYINDAKFPLKVIMELDK